MDGKDKEEKYQEEENQAKWKEILAEMHNDSAEKSKALLSLDLLSNHAVGIGDHSTKDFYSNAEEALTMLVDADDKIDALEKYFKK
mgnify:CR=1 FL=1